ncbi:MAG: CotH kinase family protein [Planctomycetota bacterium]
MLKNVVVLIVCVGLTSTVALTMAQRPSGERGFGFGPPGRGPSGGGPGGGPNQSKTKLLKKFDSDENGWLNQEERELARKELQASGNRRGGGRGFGPPGFGPPGAPFGHQDDASSLASGRMISPEEVESFGDAPLYDTTVLRTVFFEFDGDDWEKELEDFKNTDVDVPAVMTVDGKRYEGVGIRFRGASSYGHVPSGYMRSLNVSMDTVDPEQRLHGYKTLNLLNANGDASLMSTVLYSHIANQYLPTPRANFVRVVINGECWGIYTNVQQFDKIFLNENYGASKGTRWKVPGNPMADGGLRYLGEDLEPYQERFEMKSNDGKKAWRALVNLCRVLNETPSDRLISELEPILDIDQALAFLALDVALVNQDGYWTRASDYNLFKDADGKFHLMPHDMNEAFRSGGGPGGRGPGGPGGGGPGGRGSDDRRFTQRGPEPRDSDPVGDSLREAFGFGPPGGRGGRNFDGPGDGLFGGGGPGGRGPGGGPSGGPGRGGPGRGGPGAHGGIELDPLVSIDNNRFPLRSKLLAIPELRERYLALVDTIATQSLTWQSLEPLIVRSRALLQPHVLEETKRYGRSDEFQVATDPDNVTQGSLRHFIMRRSEFLQTL